jgi:hypothetical protein
VDVGEGEEKEVTQPANRFFQLTRDDDLSSSVRDAQEQIRGSLHVPEPSYETYFISLDGCGQSQSACTLGSSYNAQTGQSLIMMGKQTFALKRDRVSDANNGLTPSMQPLRGAQRG